jgi:probable selenium-dependent hydroxylase accessory protein YqeC
MIPALLQALGLDRPGAPRLVQLIGGGGKTTAMFALAHALRARGEPVVTTTTTNIHVPTAEQCEALVLLEETAEPLEALERVLVTHGHATLARARLPQGKLAGVEPGLLRDLASWRPDLRVIAECDGARGRSLKAHASHEPVLAGGVSLAVLVVGLDVLGAPLDEDHVHRAALLSQLLQRDLGGQLGPVDVARAVVAMLGCLPPAASSALLLTKLTLAREPGALAVVTALGALLGDALPAPIVVADRVSARVLGRPG